MSGLERVDWLLRDHEKRDVALRKELRADFAYALQALPSSLRDFQLSYTRRPPLDHCFQPPSILDETDRDNDKLSLALNKLSQRLVRFSLFADVGPEVLWPSERAQDDDDPLWPKMRDYSVFPGAIAPSGQWRFLRSNPEPGYESDDEARGSIDLDDTAPPSDEWENPFRRKLDPDAANALLLAAARGARRMPALRYMRFVLEGIDGGEADLEVDYTIRRGTAELVFESHPLVFRPDEGVLQVWREAAEEHAGGESGVMIAVRDSRAC